MSIDKIICVGKNYIEHAKELGDPVPENPVLFLKPASVLRQVAHWGDAIKLDFPDDAKVQPECELILRVARDGYKMSYEEAANALSDLSIGLDVTLRARQTELKKQGHPWTVAKVFKDAAIIGPWIPYEEFTNYLDTEFQMQLNGLVTQRGKGTEMTMLPVDLVVYISQFFPLIAGDVIFTGTPAGVSSIAKGCKAALHWGRFNYQVIWE